MNQRFHITLQMPIRPTANDRPDVLMNLDIEAESAETALVRAVNAFSQVVDLHRVEAGSDHGLTIVLIKTLLPEPS